MAESDSPPSIRVRRAHARLVLEHAPTIFSQFCVRLGSQTKRIAVGSSFLYMPLEAEHLTLEQLANLAPEVQSHVDALVAGLEAGEDSSYDSDPEEEDGPSHQDVSRTTSDTLGAEFAEYVSSTYAAKLEFALKLGYTEKQVQASLAKLGPSPSQNELLQELIKLGAQSPRSPDVVDPCDVPREPWPTALRPIVIDGSNVAMSHGNKSVFSCRGIEIAVDWFRARGHHKITVFVPKWRKEAPRPDNPIIDQEVLSELEREGVVVFTPSRHVGGKRTICYDDRYILRLAVEEEGIVVSNDNYRDLVTESPDFKRVVEERTLMYSFVNDRFMPPEDPLGRSGPTLDNFLRMQPQKGQPPPLCPYQKKCTYGNKCKYHHPERGPLHKSVTDRLAEQARRHWVGRDGNPATKSLSVPLAAEGGALRKQALCRTRSGVPTHPNNFEEKVGKCWSVENMRMAADQSANLHRKLQRQLTLNSAYDPRLFEMPGYMQHHASVMRIASAPDAQPPPLPTARPCASDPNLALLMPSGTEEARRKLHYHLASIFPEEQVLAALRSLPDETRPQAICAAILSMFPST